MGEGGGLEGNCGILPRKTKRGSSAGFLSEMSPNFGENFFLESCTKADVVLALTSKIVDVMAMVVHTSSRREESSLHWLEGVGQLFEQQCQLL